MDLIVLTSPALAGIKIQGIREVTRTCLVCKAETAWGISGEYKTSLFFRVECPECGESFCCESKGHSYEPWLRNMVFEQFEAKALVAWKEEITRREKECQKLIVGTPPNNPDPLLMLAIDERIRQMEEEFWDMTDDYPSLTESRVKTITEPPKLCTTTTIPYRESADSVWMQQLESQTQSIRTSSPKKKMRLRLSGLLRRLKALVFG